METILTYSFGGLALVSLFFYVFFMAKRPQGYSRKPIEIIMMVLMFLFMGAFIFFAITKAQYTEYIMIGFIVLSLLTSVLTFIFTSRYYQTR